jgi:hypothetical protein
MNYATTTALLAVLAGGIRLPHPTRLPRVPRSSNAELTYDLVTMELIP